jgi:nucleoid-associated protein YgaU
LSPTPSSSPFPTTTAGSQQQSYNPQGLASAPGGDPGTKIYEVAPGDNYWTISRKVYGAGRYFSALAEYNKARIEDPELLAPGMIVLVPTPEILDQRYSEIISSPPPGVGGTAPAGFFVDTAGQPMYRVGEADTLSGIAQTYLGRSSRWVQIYGMNREVIENADALKPGTVLQLPPDAAPIALGPEESVVR